MLIFFYRITPLPEHRPDPKTTLGSNDTVWKVRTKVKLLELNSGGLFCYINCSYAIKYDCFQSSTSYIYVKVPFHYVCALLHIVL